MVARREARESASECEVQRLGEYCYDNGKRLRPRRRDREDPAVWWSDAGTRPTRAPERRTARRRRARCLTSCGRARDGDGLRDARRERRAVQQNPAQRRESSSRPSSSASTNARFEVRSIPGRGPLPARNTGTAGRSPRGRESLSSRRSAASTTSPSVCPRSRARCLAAASKSSEIETVVRMMQVLAHQMHQAERRMHSPRSARHCEEKHFEGRVSDPSLIGIAGDQRITACGGGGGDPQVVVGDVPTVLFAQHAKTRPLIDDRRVERDLQKAGKPALLSIDPCRAPVGVQVAVGASARVMTLIARIALSILTRASTGQ